MADKNREFVLIGAGSTKAQEKIEKPALSFLQDAWRQLKKNIKLNNFEFIFI